MSRHNIGVSETHLCGLPILILFLFPEMIINLTFVIIFALPLFMVLPFMCTSLNNIGYKTVLLVWIKINIHYISIQTCVINLSSSCFSWYTFQYFCLFFLFWKLTCVMSSVNWYLVSPFRCLQLSFKPIGLSQVLV